MANSSEPRYDSAYWRNRAEESRRTAERLSDPEQKTTMLEIADGYDQLAALAIASTKPAADSR